MNIKQAKEYYALGVVSGFQAVPDGENWIVRVHGDDGRVWVLETAVRKPKTFSSMDTLINLIDEIRGFRTAMWIPGRPD